MPTDASGVGATSASGTIFRGNTTALGDSPAGASPARNYRVLSQDHRSYVESDAIAKYDDSAGAVDGAAAWSVDYGWKPSDAQIAGSNGSTTFDPEIFGAYVGVYESATQTSPRSGTNGGGATLYGGYFEAKHYGTSVVSCLGIEGIAVDYPTATGNMFVVGGGYFPISHYGSGTVTNMESVRTNIQTGASAGTVTTAVGVRVTAAFSAGTTVTNSYGVRVEAPTGAGDPTNHYGLHIADQAAGSTLARQILSEGAATVNEFVGRVIFGAPNSALADGSLANSEASFYLNEAGNTLTVKVKYAAGTVKTGTIALV